ncbi:MAG: hypothetical protein LC114_12715 [Bryobacterales bacterium]|nr:hypothetical protein [Bryobacterales bacterium]
MNNAPKELWSRAEAGEPVFTRDELHRWPGEVFERLTRMGLLRETEKADYFMCDNCAGPHSAEVIWISNARSPTGISPIISCPELGAIDVDAERLRQWVVDIPKLAALASAGLELSGPVEPVLSRGLWALGRRHLAGRFREFFLVAGVHDYNVPALVQQADRIAAAVSPVLLVPNRVPRVENLASSKLSVFSLAGLASIEGERLHLDIDFLEDALPQERAAARGKDLRSQPVAADEWSDLHLAVGETALTITANGSFRELSVEDLGFADRRKGSVAGDKVWQILRMFAQKGGAVALAEIAAKKSERQRLQKRIGILRQRLQTVFPIQGDPIRCDRIEERYHCAFQVSQMVESGLMLGHGTSWPVVRITELAGGRLQFQVQGKEVFAARRNGAENRREREAAERMVSTAREYSLDAMGLARSNGQVTEEGRALLDMLRAGGRLHRGGDDLAVLRLGKRLRSWTGIENDPFQFNVADGIWAAHFECEGPQR